MLNLLTDLPGLRVGAAECETLRSGVTVVLFDRPAIAAVSGRGGSPASRETALLAPENAVERVHAVVLSGGSTFGLDATGGVQAALREHWAATLPPVDFVRIPIVVQASLFDLGNGGDKAWGRHSPYAELGYQAARAAATGAFALGSAGAGTGATTATVKGGLGSASAVTPQGHLVAAIFAVNAVGSATVGAGPRFWAAPFERDAEFGGLGTAGADPDALALRVKPPGGWGTTIGLVATDADLTRKEALRLAIAGEDGLARAVLPAHLPRDGDTVFGAATGARPLDRTGIAFDEILHAGAIVTARAIARGVFEARSRGRPGEQPCWLARFGGSLPMTGDAPWTPPEARGT